MSSDGSPRHTPPLSASSAPSTSASPKTLLLPPSIPENREVCPVSGQDQCPVTGQDGEVCPDPQRTLSPSSKITVGLRRSSVAVTPSHSGSQPATETGTAAANTSRLAAGSENLRRRSVPTVTTFDSQRLETLSCTAVNVANARRLSQMRITEMLSNFPKVSVCLSFVALHSLLVVL